MEYYVYFLQSTKNHRFYTGLTSKSPKERLKEHNSGSNKWTQQNGPFIIAYFEKYYCEKDAREKEKFYKSGFGREVRNLILQTLNKGR